MQANTNTNSSRATLSAQSSGTPSASTISSSGKQQVVELSGYVIILVENVDGKIKLYGSPPDRDNLEVGDEILEVNGLTLDNISRTEIIRHIHDCIKTCTICLRVRKKNDTRLAWDIGNSVQDAFVIAVEEHARERLQRLAALNRVTPVDITQLSKKLQQTKSGSTTTSATTPTTTITTTTTGTLKQQPKQDLSFLHEASPIYVTSFNSNQIACQSGSTPTTASAATSGLITATTITPTPAAVVVATAATTATAGKSLTTTIAATSIVGNSNNSIANDSKTPATSLLTNHSIYQQQQQQQQLKLASSVQHLALAEEDYDDDDDDEDAAVGANYCSINFINYKNKHAEIPTPTTTISGINNCIATITSTNKDTQALAAGVLNTFSATATVHHYQQEQQQQQQQQQQNYRDHIPPPLQISPFINKPKYVDAQTLTSPRLSKDVSGLTVKRQQQQLYNNYKNNNNNNNLTSKLSTEIAIITTTTTETATAAATKLSNNNNSTSFNNLVTNNFILGLEKAAAATTTTITCTLNNLIKTTINNINTTTLNSSGLIANSIIPETTTVLTTKKPTHISNNYDLYLTNNIQAPRRELLNQLNQDSAHHYLVDELEDEDDVDDDKQLSSLSYNNSQQQQQQQFLYDNKQLNYSPNHSISKGRTELLLGDPNLRQEIRPRRRSGSSIVVIDGDDLKPCLPDDYISGQHYRTHTDDSKEIDQEMLTMLSLNQDKGPHREMAVDCPDNFIARNKTPPRYPPPRPPQVIAENNRNTRTCTITQHQPQPQQQQQHKNTTNLQIKSIHTTSSTKCALKVLGTLQPTLPALSPPTTLASTLTLPAYTLNTNSYYELLNPLSHQYQHHHHHRHYHPNTCSPPYKQLISSNHSQHYSSRRHTLPKSKKLNQYCYFTNSLQQPTRQQHHQQPRRECNSLSLLNDYADGDQHHHHHHQYDCWRLQNLYNKQQQMKLALIENYENCYSPITNANYIDNDGGGDACTNGCHSKYQTQTKNTTTSTSTTTKKAASVPTKFKRPQKLNSPNLDEERELNSMLDDPNLYYKDSSSQRSSFESEVFSKSSSNSYNSFNVMTPAQHNNNLMNGGTKHLHHYHASSSTTPSSSNNSSPNTSSTISVGAVVVQGGGGVGGGGGKATTVNNKLHLTTAVPHGSAYGGIMAVDSMPSLNSTTSTPPPEYELREFRSKSSTLLVPHLITNNNKHREVPVDVPESFMEIIKTAPRYPPPTHLASLTSQQSSCSSNSTTNTTLTRINSDTPTQQDHHCHLHHHHQHHNEQEQPAFQETSLISTTSLNGSFEDYQRQQQDLFNSQQQQLLLQNGKPQSQQQTQVTVLNGLNGQVLVTNSKPATELNGSVKPIPPPRDVATLPRGGDIVDSGSGGGRFVKNRLTSGPPSPPPPQLPDRKIILNNNNNNNTTIMAPIVGQQQQQIAQIVEPTLEQLDSIKKYQEQLRRRREEEERIAQQNEFLRASLRSSRKLKALQDTKSIQHHQQQAPPVPAERTHGVENEAYVEDENLERLAGYGDLMGALTHLQNQLTKSGMSTLAGRVSAAHNVLSNAGVAHALAARVAVLQRRQPKVTNPVHLNSMQLQRDIVELLAKSNAASSIELGNLLTSHEMEGLLLAHDRVATHTDLTPSPLLSGAASPHTSHPLSPVSVAAAPSLPSAAPMVPPLSIPPKTTSLRAVPSPVVPQRDAMPLPPNITPHHTQLPQTAIYPGTISMHTVDSPPPLSACFGTLNDQNDNIRIIKIEKSTEPLGATVRNEGEAVVIGRIVRGGAAEKSGLLHEGDEILEVNGQELRGKTVNEVCALLGTMQGTLTFLIVPAGSPPSGGGLRENAVLHVRAHFDYDPEEDLYIPCRELGISFQKGDVLHVISREDPNWWQAYREGEEDQTLAGLIPSQSFQHQRETMKLAIAEEAGLARRNKDGNNKGATLLCARKGRKKKKKASSEAGYPLYATTAPDETEPEEILTYEEVALYYPRATHKRPIVLIGPPNIGRHELRQRLMADSERFSAAVPHTSRARREGEVPGVDYHFITRQAFESDILARRFVEHGEYEKAYYGTSLEAIRAVVASGKICVLNLHPQSLKLLRASDLKPYVVLVAPPSLDKLRQKKLRNGEPFKEEELKDIIATARDMEARWGHLFDMIIINNDTERAYHQLLAEINSLEREPQWVPASWVHNNRDD